MKKYIILIVLTAVCLSACSKLELAPRGEMADKQKAYTNDIVRGQILAGIYSYCLREDTWAAFISIYMEAGTDVAISRVTSAGTPTNNSHTPTNLDNTWSYLYKGINAANEFLYYANIYAPHVKQEMYEARFLRAYYYFTLVRMFGDVPFRTEPMLDLNSTDIERTSAVAIYDFIVKELAEIQGVLADPTEVAYGHICNTAAQAALADVYLNLAGHLMKNRLPADSTSTLMHQRAATWCEKVLANPAHNITKTDYTTIFLNQTKNIPNVNEQIWELQFKYQRGSGSIRTDTRLGKYNGIQKADNITTYSAGGFIYQAASLRSLYEALDPDDKTDDTRLEWNCPREKIGKGTTLGKPVYVKAIDYDKYPDNLYQFFCGKWRTILSEDKVEAEDNNYSGSRLSMYRIADVHLMYAEALNGGAGTPAAAVEHLNIVRKRAGAHQIMNVPSQAETFELIVDERARELCFEGKRRFDLIRWGIYEKKLRELEVIYRASRDDGWVKNQLPVFDNFDPEAHCIMPIPQAEISRNLLIPQSEQNQGWGGNRKWK